MRLLARFIATTTALWVVTLLPLDVVVSGGDSNSATSRLIVFLGIGAVLTLVNLIVRPIVSFLTIPVQFLTLGLFSLVISWAMLWLSAWITSRLDFGTLAIGGFWKSLLAALVIAVVTWFVIKVLPTGEKKRR